MFVRALNLLSACTRPVTILKRLESGKVQGNCGTFINLNGAGWVLTSARVLSDLKLFEQQKAERRGIRIRESAIRADKSLSEKQKKIQLSQIQRSPDPIVNISYWWACDDVCMGEMIVDELIDLAAVRLEGPPPLREDRYAIFKNLFGYPDNFSMGRSLCRLGYPFQEIKAEYSESHGRFVVEPGTLPLTGYPHEGILARDVRALHEKTNRTARFIETSIPRLRSQGGGPIFDVEGNIWGIDTQLMYSSSGAYPSLLTGSKELADDRTQRFGIGVHVCEVLAFLENHNIQVNISHH